MASAYRRVRLVELESFKPASYEELPTNSILLADENETVGGGRTRKKYRKRRVKSNTKKLNRSR